MLLTGENGVIMQTGTSTGDPAGPISRDAAGAVHSAHALVPGRRAPNRNRTLIFDSRGRWCRAAAGCHHRATGEGHRRGHLVLCRMRTFTRFGPRACDAVDVEMPPGGPRRWPSRERR